MYCMSSCLGALSCRLDSSWLTSTTSIGPTLPPVPVGRAVGTVEPLEGAPKGMAFERVTVLGAPTNFGGAACAAWLTSTRRPVWPFYFRPRQYPVAVRDAFSLPIAWVVQHGVRGCGRALTMYWLRWPVGPGRTCRFHDRDRQDHRPKS